MNSFLFRENGWLGILCEPTELWLLCANVDRAAWSKLWASLFWKRRLVAGTGASSTVAPGMLGRIWLELMLISSWNDFITTRILLEDYSKLSKCQIEFGTMQFLWLDTWIFLLALLLRTTKCRVEEIFQFHGCNDAHSFLGVSDMSAQGHQHIQLKGKEHVTPLMDEIIYHLECWIFVGTTICLFFWKSAGWGAFRCGIAALRISYSTYFGIQSLWWACGLGISVSKGFGLGCTETLQIVKSTGTCNVPVLNSLRSIKVLLFQFAHCYRSWTKPKEGWRPPSSWVSAFKMYCCERWQGDSLWL